MKLNINILKVEMSKNTKMIIILQINTWKLFHFEHFKMEYVRHINIINLILLGHNFKYNLK